MHNRGGGGLNIQHATELPIGTNLIKFQRVYCSFAFFQNKTAFSNFVTHSFEKMTLKYMLKYPQKQRTCMKVWMGGSGIHYSLKI